MKKMSPDIVAIYHKNPKVKVSDVLTEFCHAPKFCDGTQTDTHCQFLTQLKFRINILFVCDFLILYELEVSRQLVPKILHI